MAIRSNDDAKRCVDMWLNMPDLEPGVVHTSPGIIRHSSRKRRRDFSRGDILTKRTCPVVNKEPDLLSTGSGRIVSRGKNTLTKRTCPVVNCGRVFDNAHLLMGHMKRFDHSPCDPTIHLKGSPSSELFACVACGLHFKTKEAWKGHVQSKISSSDAAEGHLITQTCQMIVCFACPACYLLFNGGDECLQHMSDKNHFTDSITLSASKGRALPVPMPRYARNRVIALCKDVPFSVRCTICRKALNSHQTAQAHFNVSCNQGGAIAVADKTVVQIVKRLEVRGQCSLCCEMFLTRDEIERHDESMQHEAEVNQTMDRAILQYSSLSEIQHAKREKERQDLTLAWFCECGQQFPEEVTACKHLLAVNRILHQCGVCGKRMGEAPLARLHMSRSHGGAHLHNYFYHCCRCTVDLPRYDDVLLHVSDAHSSGHAHITEREVV